jgi:soluble lytic murein transglycosylase-like protein
VSSFWWLLILGGGMKESLKWLIMVSLIICGCFLYDIKKDKTYLKEQLDLIQQYYVLQNQQTTLLKIINEKLEGFTIDEKVKTAKMIYDMSSIRQVPLSIVCGLAEVESGWNCVVVSTSGAEGLLQIMPLYGRSYLREHGINYKKGIWKDPVINVMVGISMLADYHAEHCEKKRTTKDNWTLALHSYLWGPGNSMKLFGKKDERVDVPNLSYPMRVIDAAKKYKELGL